MGRAEQGHRAQADLTVDPSPATDLHDPGQITTSLASLNLNVKNRELSFTSSLLALLEHQTKSCPSLACEAGYQRH